MSAIITQTLMGLGELRVGVDDDAELAAEIVGPATDGRGIIVYQGEELVDGWIKVGDAPSREGTELDCVGTEWLLGGDNDIGPTVDDREYIAGNNKLANPAFQDLGSEETTDPTTGLPAIRTTADAWKLADSTGWLIALGLATSTLALLAGTTVDPSISLPGDILTSDESFETRGGNLWKGQVTAVRRSGATGRLRLRLVYDGHFRHPNLLAPFPTGWAFDPGNVSGDAAFVTTDVTRLRVGPVTQESRQLTGWVNTSPYSGDLSIGGTIRLGPTTQPQFLSDPSFESGFTYWIGNTGTDPGSGFPNWDNYASYPWGGGTILPHSGANMVGCGAAPTDTGEEVRYLESLNFVSVQPGERYLLEGYIAEGPVTIGDATVYLVPIPGVGVQRWIPSQSVHGRHLTTGPTAQQWKKCHLEYSVPPGIVELAVLCYATFDRATWPGVATPAGLFFFDDVTLTRISGNRCSALSASMSVVPLDSYTVSAQVTADAGTLQGSVVMTVVMSGPGQPDITVNSNTVTQDAKATTVMRAEVDPPDGYTSIQATITGSDIVGGGFTATLGTVVRTAGNTAKVSTGPIPVISEEAYLLVAPVTPGAGITNGNVGFSLLCQGPGRPDQVLDGPSIDGSDTTPAPLQFPFSPPSGYDTVVVSAVGTDILGGAFTVGIPTMNLSDNKRAVADLAIGPVQPSLATSSLTSTAPAGAEHVHLTLIAEDKGDGWEIHSAWLGRAEPPVRSAAVIDDIGIDPLSGVRLIDAGNIVGSEYITFDWHVLRLTLRAMLQHLSRAGVALPVREWRIYVDPATGRPTMDWGVAEAIFNDRRELIFVDDDLLVISPAAVQRSGEARVTRVEVVGADRQRPDGPPTTVTGEADNDSSDFLDWSGHPLNRTQTIAEPSVDHPDYAASYARYRADQANLPTENVRMQISDWRAWGPFNVGDWLYVFKPDAGLVDPSNPMPYNGQTVYPKKLRLLSRTWRLGSGDFRLEIHRPGLDSFVVPDELVAWEADTTAELELGDPHAGVEFAVDSQGGAPGDQFRRFRASMPG